VNPPRLRIVRGNSEAEAAVLGACFLDPRAIDACLDALLPSDFEEPFHRAVFTAMGKLRSTGHPVDPISVLTTLGVSSGDDRTVARVLGIADARATAVNVEHHIHLVTVAARRRRILDAIQDAGRIVAEAPEGDATELDDAGRRAVDVVESAVAITPPTRERTVLMSEAITSLGHTVKERFDAVRDNRPIRSHIPTGVAGLDTVIDGYPIGEVSAIGAREKAGKSSLGMQAVVAAATAGYGVVVISYEVPHQQLAARGISARAGIPVSRMMRGTMDDGDVQRYVQAAKTLGDQAGRAQLHWVPGSGIEYIEAAVRRYRRSEMQANVPLGLVVVDHIGRIKRDKRANLAEHDHLYEVAERFTTLCADVGVAGLMLSQHNQGHKARAAGDKWPRSGDMRGGAALAELASVIVQVHRPSMDLHDQAPPEDDECHLCVTLHRHGPPAHVPVMFNGPRQMFIERRSQWRG